MKHQGFKNKEIMDALGIRHVAQIKTWMKWYREGETIGLNNLSEDNLHMEKA